MQYRNIKFINNNNLAMVVCFLLAARCVCTFFIPLADPTEGRYATISKQMAQSGDWLTPQIMINGEMIPFEGKPPLFFWIDALSIKLLGANEFAARLPNMMFFAFSLGFMWLILKSYQDAATAWRAVFFTISSVVLFIAAGLVIVDILLMATISGSLLAHYAFLMETNQRIRKIWSLTVFVMLAAGFMTKGPVAILLFAMPLCLWTAYNRDWKMLKEYKWFTGALLFLILTVPWFALSEIKHPGFCKYFFVNENFLRFISHDYGDKYGNGHLHIRGTAILMMIAAACPWSIIAIYLLIKKRQTAAISSLLKDGKDSFLLIAVLSTTLFWAMARQLLITYMFPMVPIFSAWLAIYIRKLSNIEKKEYPLFNSHAVSICLITVLCMTAASPVISRCKSAKGIIEIAEDMIEAPSGIYFLRTTPYSAYFYASDKIIRHKEIPVEKSIEIASKNTDRNIVYIVRTKYLDRLPACGKKNICVLRKFGNYTMFQTFSQITHTDKPAK